MQKTLRAQHSISAILITLNEEQNLARCLQSLGFCEEIIVIDGGSSDQTMEIAKNYNAKIVVEKEWKGFGDQKSIALTHARCDWVLSIDADEVVSPELKSSILVAIQQEKFKGFYVNRTSNFLGRWMRYGGWYPDWVLRLAKREACYFDLAPIHEKLLVRGNTSRITGNLFHYSYPTIESILYKQVRYSLDSARLKAAQYRHYSVIFALFRAFWIFAYNYVLRLGFLDGVAGLIAAASKSQETFWKYVATNYVESNQKSVIR